MTIKWKLISYLMAFLSGVEWGREHPWLCFGSVCIGLISYWYIENGTLSSEREEDSR